LTGYSTYIGMIMVDVYHRNPIMTVFCDELLSRSKTCTNILITPVDPETNNGMIKQRKLVYQSKNTSVPVQDH
jgi:hypothetical protein